MKISLINRASGRSRKENSNFAGFSGTNSRKKTADFAGIFKATVSLKNDGKERLIS